MRRVWILAVMLLAWSNFAGATVIISNAGTHTEASGVVDWFYNVALGSDQVFRRGDYFTIYDVPNIANVPDSVFFASVSGSFTPTIAGLTPPDPFGAVTNDDSGINNIKITLDDIPANTTITPGAANIILGTLTIKSTTAIPLQTNYAAQAGLKPSGTLDSTSVGLVDVAAVPEPSSVTLMVLGLVAFGAVALRRRGG